VAFAISFYFRSRQNWKSGTAFMMQKAYKWMLHKQQAMSVLPSYL
jgi:hypothetical protein